MATSNPYLNTPKRYARSFEAVNVNQFISPYFNMAPATTGVAGMVLQYSATTEDTVVVASSGALRHQIAGFLEQDVKDLDSGAIKGYRNMNNTVVNLADNVGVAQGFMIAFTKVYTGSPAIGNRLAVCSNTTNNLSGYLEVYATLTTQDPLAVVEAATSSIAPTVEPQQMSASSGANWIRIKTYNF